jgi:hypothetical protein
LINGQPPSQGPPVGGQWRRGTSQSTAAPATLSPRPSPPMLPAGVDIYPLPMSETFIRSINFDRPVKTPPNVQEPIFYKVSSRWTGVALSLARHVTR